jgi:hypothetical protein
MNRKNLLLWAPRILGMAVSAFLSVLALDAFEPARPLAQVLMEVAIHLVPAAIVFALVALAWRSPLVGGLAFVFLACGYAMSVRFRPDWMLAISGPLVTVGLLFLWSWRTRRQPAGRLL